MKWRNYLKPDWVYCCLSESSWFTEVRPAEIHDSLDAGVSRDLDTIPVKVAQPQKVGYLPSRFICIAEKCWTEH